MIIVEKTEGEKITYSQMGENLLVLDDVLYLNLAYYEREFPVSIDISRNEYGMITMGTSRSYVAQIDIPAREFVEVAGEELDEDGEETKSFEPVPFEMDKVILTLWGETR